MRKIDEKAMPFLKEKGYGKGTNYTTDLVASLMVQFAEKQGQELPIHNVVVSLFCDCELPTNNFELDDGTICCCLCEKELVK